MRCGPQTAARYLGGELRPGRRRAYDRHLLVCEPCWTEVRLGRDGRRLAEQARELAPPELRERLRLVVAAEPAPVRHPHQAHGHRRRFVAVAAAVALLGAGAYGLRPDPVGPLDAAVADYRAARLPGVRLPSTAAPDLAAMGLTTIGAASGAVDGRSVTAYAYRDATGARVLVYRSEEPFPDVEGARRLAGPDGPWVSDEGGVTVLCANDPYALLVLGDASNLVMSVAHVLQVT